MRETSQIQGISVFGKKRKHKGLKLCNLQITKQLLRVNVSTLSKIIYK